MKWMTLSFLVLCLLPFSGCAGSGDNEADGGTDLDGEWNPPDFWDPGDKPDWNCNYGYGDECIPPEVDCSKDPCVHGTCQEGEGESGADACVCDEGYAGLLCDQCAEGYIPSGLECVRGDPCQDSPCVFGTCRVHDEQMVCDCYTGYTGTYCDECDEGYHIENMECVPD
jgi:hypothetical protein